MGIMKTISVQANFVFIYFFDWIGSDEVWKGFRFGRGRKNRKRKGGGEGVG